MASRPPRKQKPSIQDGLRLEALEPSAQEAAIDQFCEKYDINPQFKSKLAQLAGYKIAVILDDSGSMANASDARLEGVVSRWDELKLMYGILVELYALFSADGLDIHFLNRGSVKAVKQVDDKRVTKKFKDKPAGGTPTCEVLQRILNDEIFDPRIIIIATDGEATARDGSSDMPRLRQVLVDRNADKNFVSIVACTGDDAVLDVLNRLDVQIRNLDVVDDYRSERAEVLTAQGYDFPFNYRDYVIKLVLGAVDPYFDKLDEMTAARRAELKRASDCNCTIL